jgi:hypothetical protein
MAEQSFQSEVVGVMSGNVWHDVKKATLETITTGEVSYPAYRCSMEDGTWLVIPLGAVQALKVREVHADSG